MADEQEFHAWLAQLRAETYALEERMSVMEDSTLGLEPPDRSDDEVPMKKRSLGWKIRGAVVTIFEGRIRLHGAAADITVSEGTVTLTGEADEWVFIQRAHGSTTSTIEHSTTEPKSDSSYLKIPLLHFNVVGGSYQLVRDHHSDIHIGVPMR